MSKKGVIQAGGTKEAPLAVVGSSRSDIPLHDRTRDKRYTPNDAEYQQYSELIKGFFQKFTRWQEILAADECKEGEGLYRGFSVLRSENGLSIVPGWRLEKGDPKEKDEVLYLSSFTGDLEYVPSIQFTIRPGQAGKHLFTGADNQPVERVIITCQRGDGLLNRAIDTVKIEADRYKKRKKSDAFYSKASYEFDRVEDILRVSNATFLAYSYWTFMTDEKATSLINTIDALIPGSTTATPQPGRKTTPELVTPRLLPAPTRRSAATRTPRTAK